MARQSDVDWKRVIGIGLIGAAVLGMVEMVLEWGLATEGFWAPMLYIGALLLRDFQTVASPPGFIMAPVLVGMIVHMMVGVTLAAAFVAGAARWTPNTGALAAAGIAYGAVVFLVMWYVALPLFDPVMLRLNGLLFFVSHLMWGLTVGLLASAAIPETATGRRRAERRAV